MKNFHLNNYLLLHDISNKVNYWKDSFIAEAEQRSFSRKETKFNNVIELRKNYRGKIEVIFKEEENDLIAYFGYRFPIYCKIIGWVLSILFFSFIILGGFVNVILDILGENYIWSWGFIISFASGGLLLIFGLAFSFLIAKYDYKRGILLPDQRDELMTIAMEIQVIQTPSSVSENNYKTIKQLPSSYKQILIVRNIDEINTWRETFLDLVKENDYVIKNITFFNYIQLIKNKKTFEIEFNIDSTTLILFIGFRRPPYVLPLFLGGFSSSIIFGILAGISDLYLDQLLIGLFIGILVASIGFLLGFLIYYHVFIMEYDSDRKIAAPDYIDELMKTAINSQENQ